MRSGGLALIILLANGINNFDCAQGPPTLGRIVRGNDAASGQFPYVVRLYASVKSRCGCITQRTVIGMCGGALISPTWILTAAHCIADSKSVEIYLGSILRDNAKVTYNLPSSKYRIHPQYNSRKVHNDIALINIPHTSLCSKIRIVPLPKFRSPQPKYEEAHATACGWGVNSHHGNLPRILQCGRFQILPSDECRYLGIIETQICTSLSSDFATIKCGDSGGPLVVESTGELVGIGSVGDTGNCENDPPFFTRVTSYLKWIKTVSGVSY